MTLCAISVNIKYLFVRLNSAVFKVFICENRKLPSSCLKHPLFQHLQNNPKRTAVRHTHMVNVAKHALSSKVFSPLFTQAWKLLPGYFLFFVEYRSLNLQPNNNRQVLDTEYLTWVVMSYDFGVFHKFHIKWPLVEEFDYHRTKMAQLCNMGLATVVP